MISVAIAIALFSAQFAAGDTTSTDETAWLQARRAVELVECAERWTLSDADRVIAEGFWKDPATTRAALAGRAQRADGAASERILLARVLRLEALAKRDPSALRGEPGIAGLPAGMKEGIDLLTRELERDSTLAEAHWALARYHGTLVNRPAAGQRAEGFAQADPSGALEHARLAFARTPNDPRYREELVYRLILDQRDDEALVLARAGGASTAGYARVLEDWSRLPRLASAIRAPHEELVASDFLEASFARSDFALAAPAHAVLRVWLVTAPAESVLDAWSAVSPGVRWPKLENVGEHNGMKVRGLSATLLWQPDGTLRLESDGDAPSYFSRPEDLVMLDVSEARLNKKDAMGKNVRLTICEVRVSDIRKRRRSEP